MCEEGRAPKARTPPSGSPATGCAPSPRPAATSYWPRWLGLLGQVVATLSRSSVVSLATGVMIAIPLDMIVTDTIESARPWLPGQLFQAVAQGPSSWATGRHSAPC